jgi:HEAT repeat protein
MSDSSNARTPFSPDETLPRVEPPNAGFIVQLFIVPAVIVLVIVMVWVMFTWLAQMGSDPHQYIAQIRKNNDNSWIAAHNLAEELRTKPALKTNAAVAAELGAMLSELIDRGGRDSEEIRVRVFLCRALGEFQVTDGLPALIKAAQTERAEEEVDVRRSALEAIALLVDHRENKETPADTLHPELMPTLLSASREDNARIREGAAYALGVVGGSEGLARLKEMLGDVEANVRFNAATGLARQKDLSSIEVLVEMLNLEETAGLKDEEGPQARDFKRALIVINGLRAAKQLADGRPDADLSQLTSAVESLLASDMARQFHQADYASEIRTQATTLLKELQQRAVPAAS